MNLDQHRLGYTVDQFVEATGVGRTTVYGLIRDGKLATKKFGKRRIVLADSARQLFQESA